VVIASWQSLVGHRLLSRLSSLACCSVSFVVWSLAGSSLVCHPLVVIACLPSLVVCRRLFVVVFAIACLSSLVCRRLFVVLFVIACLCCHRSFIIACWSVIACWSSLVCPRLFILAYLSSCLPSLVGHRLLVIVCLFGICVAGQNAVLFVAIPEIFAAQLDKMQCFWSQFKNFAARLNRTEYTAFGRNSKKFPQRSSPSGGTLSNTLLSHRDDVLFG
jgi:hypothetical protein